MYSGWPTGYVMFPPGHLKVHLAPIKIKLKETEMAKIKFKSPLGELMWCFIKDGGVDTSVERTGEPKAMKKVANVLLKAGTPELAAIQDELKQVWDKLREEDGIKVVTPSSNGLKAIKDKETQEPTGDYVLCFKTSAKYPDGTDVVIPIYNAKGERTELPNNAIGNGSLGIVHGEAAIYKYAGKVGITLYLKAIQIATYKEPDSGIEAEDLTVLYPDLDGQTFEAQTDVEPIKAPTSPSNTPAL